MVVACVVVVMACMVMIVVLSRCSRRLGCRDARAVAASQLGSLCWHSMVVPMVVIMVMVMITILILVSLGLGNGCVTDSTGCR